MSDVSSVFARKKKKALKKKGINYNEDAGEDREGVPRTDAILKEILGDDDDSGWTDHVEKKKVVANTSGKKVAELIDLEKFYAEEESVADRLQKEGIKQQLHAARTKQDSAKDMAAGTGDISGAGASSAAGAAAATEDKARPKSVSFGGVSQPPQAAASAATAAAATGATATTAAASAADSQQRRGTSLAALAASRDGTTPLAQLAGGGGIGGGGWRLRAKEKEDAMRARVLDPTNAEAFPTLGGGAAAVVSAPAGPPPESVWASGAAAKVVAAAPPATPPPLPPQQQQPKQQEMAEVEESETETKQQNGEDSMQAQRQGAEGGESSAVVTAGETDGAVADLSSSIAELSIDSEGAKTKANVNLSAAAAALNEPSSPDLTVAQGPGGNEKNETDAEEKVKAAAAQEKAEISVGESSENGKEVSGNGAAEGGAGAAPPAAAAETAQSAAGGEAAVAADDLIAKFGKKKKKKKKVDEDED